MFRYFPESPMLSQGVLMALNAGGEINEIDRACRAVELRDGVPLPGPWYDAWSGLGAVLMEQAAADEARGRLASAAPKYRRALRPRTPGYAQRGQHAGIATAHHDDPSTSDLLCHHAPPYSFS